MGISYKKDVKEGLVLHSPPQEICPVSPFPDGIFHREQPFVVKSKVADRRPTVEEVILSSLIKLS